MTTHAEMLAAIDKVQRAAPFSDPPIVGEVLGDTLRAILDLHPQYGVWCGTCFSNVGRPPYPCPNVQVVADALTKIGALDG
jgi:hypothetical protein